MLLHRERARIPGPEQVPRLRGIYEQWSPYLIGIEAVAYQLAVVQEARRDGLPIRELRPDKDKVSRALVAAARMEGGQVWLPVLENTALSW